MVSIQADQKLAADQWIADKVMMENRHGGRWAFRNNQSADTQEHINLKILLFFRI